MAEEKTYNEVVEEIRNKLDILEVIQTRVVLKKRGANYWGCCPFHNEKTPSFCVNVEKGIFKCFGCGEGGNAITFLMKINNQTFSEVIEELAIKYGIELPRAKVTNKGYREEKEKIKKAIKEASEYYYENLQKNKEAIEYLEKRGIKKEIIERYKLGYAKKGYTELQNEYKSRYTPEILEKAGLTVKTEKGKIVDRFRNRIMIPIRDEKGEIIAFGARGIEAEQKPKYLNSPDTILYNKSRILYGIDIAKEEMLKEDYCVIMEGYFDVITAQAAGLKNAVATCGTALTVDHVKLIAKYTKSRKIYLGFDTDSAGIKARERSSEVIKEAFEGLGDIKIFDQLYSGINNDKYTCEIRVIEAFQSKDPDEYIRENGIERYKEYIKRAPLLIDYELEQIFKGYKKEMSPTDKLEIIKKIMPLIEEIPNNIVQNEYIRIISDRIKIDERSLIKEINRAERYKEPQEMGIEGIVTKTSNVYEKAQKNLLCLFLTDESKIDRKYLEERIKNVKFIDKKLNIIKEAIDKISCQVNNDVEKIIQSLYEQFAEDNEIKTIITDIIYMTESFKDLRERDYKAVIQENITKIQHYQTDCEKEELTTRNRSMGNDEIESMEFQMQLREKIRNKQKIGEKS